MKLFGNWVRKPGWYFLMLACVLVVGAGLPGSVRASTFTVNQFETGFGDGYTPDGCVIPDGGYATGEGCFYAKLSYVKATVTIDDPSSNFSWAFSVDPANKITSGVCNGVCWEIGANYLAATQKGNIYVAFPNTLGEGYLDWGFDLEKPWEATKGFGALCPYGDCALPIQTSFTHFPPEWTGVFGEPSVIPLPATLPFLVAGLGALMVVARRRTTVEI